MEVAAAFQVMVPSDPELSKTVGQWDRAEGKSPDEEIAGFPKNSGVVVEGREEQKSPTWCLLR